MGANMATLLLILQLLSALPSLIKVVMEIIKLIKGLDGESKAVEYSKLKDMLERAKRGESVHFERYKEELAKRVK